MSVCSIKQRCWQRSNTTARRLRNYTTGDRDTTREGFPIAYSYQIKDLMKHAWLRSTLNQSGAEYMAQKTGSKLTEIQVDTHYFICIPACNRAQLNHATKRTSQLVFDSELG